MTDYASCLLQLAFLFKTSYILAFPPKSEFVENARSLKIRYFRHFIYVNLGILVELYKNRPFTCKTHKNRIKNTKFFCPLLDISVSGSPIIQNGQLIGAVTHVLVNDPTTGYGIFIENMLDAAA